MNCIELSEEMKSSLIKVGEIIADHRPDLADKLSDDNIVAFSIYLAHIALTEFNHNEEMHIAMAGLMAFK